MTREKWLMALAGGLLAWGWAGFGHVGLAAQDSGTEPVVEPVEKVILNISDSLWRRRVVRETVDVEMAPGRVEHARFELPSNYFRTNPKALYAPEGAYQVAPVPMVRLPEHTDPDWSAFDYDDSAWIRSSGPLFHRTGDTEWKLIQMRARFEVSDAAAAGDLSFSMAFHGGAVVYLNGREIARRFMPDGPISPTTPSQAYPLEVYLQDNGYLIWQHAEKEQFADRAEKRIRRIDNLVIPASRLRPGVNVLAVGIHRAPAPPRLYLGRLESRPHGDARMHWSRAALFDARLTAAPDSPIPPNVGRIPGRGFTAWNHSIAVKVFTTDYPDPFAPLQPIRITGVRNGLFAGQVVLGHDEPIRGLSAVVSDLTGPATVPGSAVTVGWALPDGRGGFFDTLEDDPPAEVPVQGEGGGSIQPVWINVEVPAGAAEGDYRGAVTVRAEGAGPLTIPIHLRVIGWTLPPPRELTSRMDIIQSPESVAMAYDVEMWSEEHWKLLDRTFSLLERLSARTIYITAIRRTHFGNEHAMIRWTRDADGELQPDFSIAERYLDMAIRHLGKIPGVILYVWEPPTSMGHAGGSGGASRTHDKPILLTVTARGGGREATGPAWGTPEARELWKRLTDGMQEVLAKRGMADSLLFGLVGDHRPTRQAMDDVTAAVKDPRWAVHSHYYVDRWQEHAIGYCSALWGVRCRPTDPSNSVMYGWMNPFWLNYYPRELSELSSLVEYRSKLETWMGAVGRGGGIHGLGRLGADFWVVVRDSRGRLRGTLAGRYPESYWGQLNLNYCVPRMFGRGARGAVPTVRSESFRENVQEMEARIAIERVVEPYERAEQARAAIAAIKASGRTDARTAAELDGAESQLAEVLAAGPLIDPDLYARCRAALNERIRMGLHGGREGEDWFVSSGWNERNEKLFRLAAEVAAVAKR